MIQIQVNQEWKDILVVKKTWNCEISKTREDVEVKQEKVKHCCKNVEFAVEISLVDYVCKSCIELVDRRNKKSGQGGVRDVAKRLRIILAQREEVFCMGKTFQ